MVILENIKELGNILTDFVFPQSCFVCGKMGTGICRQCLIDQPRARPKCLKCGAHNPFGLACRVCRTKYTPDRTLALYEFDGPIREMIHLFKYEDYSALAQCFGGVLAEEFASARDVGGLSSASRAKVAKDSPLQGTSSWTIVPIPLSKKRVAWRGYNQSLLLAREIAKRSGFEVRELLRRKDSAESQVQSGTKEKRRANIKGVFEVIEPVWKNILLVDDVITSGATVLEATRVLKHAGAKKVCVLALAMGKQVLSGNYTLSSRSQR